MPASMERGNLKVNENDKTSIARGLKCRRTYR